uniref:Response regulatory domain-containing protein n=1 Tax=Physcomitrium patens TaxID=3218 RepID=A0A7I4BKH4_PHYPA
MSVHPSALAAMVRKSLKPEVPAGSVKLNSFLVSKPRKVSEFAKHKKLKETGSKKSKKTRQSNSEPSIAKPQLSSSAEDPVQRKLVGEKTAESINLISASIESYCADPVHNDLLSELVGTKPVPMISSSQYHVLTVDDSRIDQRVVEKLLMTSSFKVTTVNSALRALELLGLSDSCPSSVKKPDINLIMTDYCMPEMTGYDLLKRVKADTSALKEIPVVVMSSENDSIRIERCLAEGAEEFIIKPVQMADVKRLRGHLRPVNSTSGSSSATASGSSDFTCGSKRKAESSDPQEVNNMTK